jgi:exodeoxyribonuclease-3
VTLRLLTYNIRYGGAGREAALAAVIGGSGADVVVLQEATRPEVLEAVARATGMQAWASRRGNSLAFMSRMAVERYAWHQPRGSRHAFLEVVVAGGACRVFGVHLSAVHAAWTEARRVRELRALLSAIARRHDGLDLLAGDFNSLAPGEILEVHRLPFRLRPFVWLSGGTIRWRTIREVLDADYIDAYRALHPGDAGLTFPTARPHVRLDYVFVPAPYLARLQSCAVVTGDPAPSASDHFPLLAEIEL